MPTNCHWQYYDKPTRVSVPRYIPIHFIKNKNKVLPIYINCWINIETNRRMVLTIGANLLSSFFTFGLDKNLRGFIKIRTEHDNNLCVYINGTSGKISSVRSHPLNIWPYYTIFTVNYCSLDKCILICHNLNHFCIILCPWPSIHHTWQYVLCTFFSHQFIMY